MSDVNNTTPAQQAEPVKMKFCKHCGGKIPEDAVLCVLCGRQVEELRQAVQPQVIVNNTNTNANVNTNTNVAGMGYGLLRNKWVAFFLCLFTIVGHKFYEGKIGMGILYCFTAGLFGIGWFVDLISLLLKPNPYYVR